MLPTVVCPQQGEDPGSKRDGATSSATMTVAGAISKKDRPRVPARTVNQSDWQARGRFPSVCTGQRFGVHQSGSPTIRKGE